MTVMLNKAVTIALGLCGVSFAISPALAGQCRDPWITQAITEITGRTPNGANESGECTYTQYGGGNWSNYAQLKGFVQQRLGTPMSFGGGGSIGITSLPKQNRNGQTFVYYSGEWMQIVASGGGNIVASGGGNIISTNGGGFELISRSGARIVTNATGNIISRSGR